MNITTSNGPNLDPLAPISCLNGSLLACCRALGIWKKIHQIDTGSTTGLVVLAR